MECPNCHSENTTDDADESEDFTVCQDCGIWFYTPEQSMLNVNDGLRNLH